MTNDQPVTIYHVVGFEMVHGIIIDLIIDLIWVYSGGSDYRSHLGIQWWL